MCVCVKANSLSLASYYECYRLTLVFNGAARGLPAITKEAQRGGMRQESEWVCVYI